MLPSKCPRKFHFPAIGAWQTTRDEEMKRMVTGLRSLEKFSGRTGKRIVTEVKDITSAVEPMYHFVTASRKNANTFEDLFRNTHKQRGGVAYNTVDECKISSSQLMIITNWLKNSQRIKSLVTLF